MDEKIQLLLALTRLVGNKVYLRDLEKTLEKLSLEPQEKQTLRMLARDIEQASMEKDQSRRRMF